MNIPPTENQAMLMWFGNLIAFADGKSEFFDYLIENAHSGAVEGNYCLLT